MNKHQVFKFNDGDNVLTGKTLIMGVLNITPDSFYDGGRYSSLDEAIKRAEQIVGEGADIIDVGGESTRPGSDGVDVDEEMSRVLPVISEIRRRFEIPISIDTTKASVARAALDKGAVIINDISGLKFDPEIADVAAEYRAGLILMHTPSRPKDMQALTSYGSLLDDIKSSLSVSIELAQGKGVATESIVIDPGIGFGKTVLQNLQIIGHLNEFLTLGRPILIGASRKSFIGRVLEADVDDRLEGTAATIAIAISRGASIVRVHDILQMKRVAKMADNILYFS